MSIKVNERIISRPVRGIGPDREITLAYVVEGTPDEQLALDAMLAEAPEVYRGLGRADVTLDPENVDEEGSGCDVWYGTVRYITEERLDEDRALDEALERGTAGLDPDSRDLQDILASETVDDVGVQFITNTEGATVRYPLSRVNFTDNLEGVVNGINVESGAVRGVDVPVPVVTAVLTERMGRGDFDTVYAGYQELVGQVNSDTFNNLGPTFEPGEVLYLGPNVSDETTINVSGSSIVFETVYTVAHNFAIQSNGEISNVETITGGDWVSAQGDKEGWDYFWVLYEDENLGSGSISSIPRGGFIDRVHGRSSMSGQFPNIAAPPPAPTINVQPTGGPGPRILECRASAPGVFRVIYRWQFRESTSDPWQLASGNYAGSLYSATVRGRYRCLAATRGGTTVSTEVIVTGGF